MSAAAVEDFADFLKGAGFGNFGAIEQPGHRFAQRAAEQRMIVGDQQMMGLRLAQRDDLAAHMLGTRILKLTAERRAPSTARPSAPARFSFRVVV